MLCSLQVLVFISFLVLGGIGEWGEGCAGGILFPWPGIKPVSLLCKHGVLTTGPPGKSLSMHFSSWIQSLGAALVPIVDCWFKLCLSLFFLLVTIIIVSFYFLKLINLFILLYNIVLILPYIDLNPPWVYMCSPSWTPLSPSSLSHPSGSSQCTSPKHPVSCIEPGLATPFTYDNLHVSMPFSHIISPLPSPTESKRMFNTSVSLLLSHIQGYRYHLSKFHIYALVYCIGVLFSGLLHSV